MNVYAINEYDWMIGASLEDCINEYILCYGDPEIIDEPQELTETQLESLTHFVDERDEGGELLKRTFKEQLAIEVATGGDFPRLFTSTEY